MIDIDAVLARVTYKPGWKFNTLRTNPRILSSQATVPNAHPPHDETTIYATCNLDDKVLESEESFLAFLHQFIVQVETHEADEWLAIDGEKPWDPHKYELSRNELVQ